MAATDTSISKYLVDLVTDDEKMADYWTDREAALVKSGLTPEQQQVLRERHHGSVIGEPGDEREEPEGPVGPDAMGPDLGGDEGGEGDGREDAEAPFGADAVGPDLGDDDGDGSDRRDEESGGDESATTA